MQMILAKNMGFCFGVRRAVEMALNRAAEQGSVYSLGELIHNKCVVEELASRGVIPINSLEELPEGGTLVIRSHGVPRRIYDECAAKGVSLVDCTCPFVKKIHGIVGAQAEEGRRIVIAGDPSHPETIGINGWCGDAALFVRSPGEVDALKETSAPDEQLCLVSQTTFDLAAFKRIEARFRELFPDAVVFNTVCSTTEERQKEAEEISSKCDVMLVLGDLHPYKYPRIVEFVPELPKTHSGKIRRNALRDAK